jgi:hypothetical protein
VIVDLTLTLKIIMSTLTIELDRDEIRDLFIIIRDSSRIILGQNALTFDEISITKKWLNVMQEAYAEYNTAKLLMVFDGNDFDVFISVISKYSKFNRYRSYSIDKTTVKLLIEQKIISSEML